MYPGFFFFNFVSIRNACKLTNAPLRLVDNINGYATDIAELRYFTFQNKSNNLELFRNLYCITY